MLGHILCLALETGPLNIEECRYCVMYNVSYIEVILYLLAGSEAFL